MRTVCGIYMRCPPVKCCHLCPLAIVLLTRSISRFPTMAYSHGTYNADTLQRENVSDSSDQSLSQGKEEGAVYRENVVESNETDLAPAHDGFQKEVLETADPHFTVSKAREQQLVYPSVSSFRQYFRAR